MGRSQARPKLYGCVRVEGEKSTCYVAEYLAGDRVRVRRQTGVIVTYPVQQIRSYLCDSFKKKMREYRASRFGIKKYCPCDYCGRKLEFPDATVDHVVPRALNGANHRGNYAIACRSCNNLKSHRAPEEFAAFLRGEPDGTRVPSISVDRPTWSEFIDDILEPERFRG